MREDVAVSYDNEYEGGGYLRGKGWWCLPLRMDMTVVVSDSMMMCRNVVITYDNGGMIAYL
jgi:hypothetical protein